MLLKSIVATAVALSLVACSQSDADYEKTFKSSTVAQASMDQTNVEKDAAYQLTRHLRMTDPKIESVEPVIENGQRTLMISRTGDNGTIETWKMNPADYERMMAEANSKSTAPKSESGFDTSSALTGALVGMVAGHLLSNAFNSNTGTNSNFQSRAAYNQNLNATRQSYASGMTNRQSAGFDRERERERRGGGTYMSPAIAAAATNNAARTGNSGYRYSGVSNGSPSAASARAAATSNAATAAAAGRSASSGQAFSSGARGASSSGG